MEFRRRTAIFAAVTACCAAGVLPTAHAQAEKQPYPAHLPYSFSNFVWWTDDELRVLLKKRIPSLGDEVTTTTEAEGHIRDALTALLREKGISARVMSEEPSPTQLRTTPPDLFGVDVDDLPPVPRPSVIFELVKPQVGIGVIKVQANNDDAQTAAEKELQGNEGKAFGESGLSFSQYEVEKSLKQLGYFSAQVGLRHGQPYKQGERYLVDEIVLIDTGPKYHIASITAAGGPLLTGRDLSRFFTVRPGDPAVPSPFGQLGPQLRAFYQQYGYADVHITSDPVFDRDHATVSYALQVNPGPVYHLRSLTIEKLDTEQEKRVREIFDMKPGDLYREQAITELYRAISNEPLLKGYTFSFSPKPDRTAAVVDLTLEFGKEGGNATVTVQ
jgi:hypothetical protein